MWWLCCEEIAKRNSAKKTICKDYSLCGGFFKWAKIKKYQISRQHLGSFEYDILYTPRKRIRHYSKHIRISSLRYARPYL